MQKAYSRIIYKNYPSTDTPLNETNLNHMDGALDTIDDRVVAMDTTKANQADMLQAIKTISYDETTGVFTITFFNNTSITIDTDIEKIAINFDYDDDPTSATYQKIIITLEDGTKKYIDLSALITQYEFTNSSTVAFTISGGNVSASVIDGSITEAKLQPNFLADVKAEVAKAENFSEDAEAWAKGTRGGDPVESTDPTYNNNAKHYSEVASDEKDSAEAWANGEINGQPVPSTHPAYQNNAKYYKDLANPTTFKALTDVTTDQSFNGIDMTGIQDGQTIVFDNTTGEMVPGDAGGAAINDIFNVYGSKNLNPFPYYGPATDPTIASVDEDGVITYNGQAGGGTLVYLLNDPSMLQQFTLPVGRYILSIEVANMPSQSIGITAQLMYKSPEPSSVPTTVQVHSVGDGKFSQIFDFPSDKYITYISTVFNGSATFSNTTIKVMLRRATVKDDTYAPPAYSNRQLTLKHNVKDMNDTEISQPTPGQTLVYNNEGKLVNATPSGSGHTMVNNAGTALTQRANLQTKGSLNVVDNSGTNTTEITDVVEEVPWATWQSYPSEEAALQAHPNCVVTGAPDCDGDIEIENMHLAWENPNPTSAFAAQNITLNTDDYDGSVWIAKVLGADVNTIGLKGDDVFLTASNGSNNYGRYVTRNSDVSFSVADATVNGTTNNNQLIPLAVYTYKKNLTAKIQAIARNVSTEASKCMLDENTSVADVVGYGSVKVTANGVKTYSQLFNELFALVDMSRIKNSSVFVFDYQNSSGTKYQYLLQEISNIYLVFNRMSASSSGARIESFYLASTGSTNMQATGSTRNDISAQVPSSGWEFKIYY